MSQPDVVFQRLSVGVPSKGPPPEDEDEHGSYDFFFYGTLCHPAILIRVLGHNGDGLQFQDAILPNYTRHHVKNEDYPAVIDREQTSELFNADPSIVFVSEDFNTRGTLVRGLSYKDMQALDIFEGVEYSRQKLLVEPLTEPCDIQHLPICISNPSTREHLDNIAAKQINEAMQRTTVDSVIDDVSDKALADILTLEPRAGNVSAPPRNGTQETVAPPTPKRQNDMPQKGNEEGKGQVNLPKAWVYVWSDKLDKLEPKVWSFSSFLEEKAHLWTGLATTEFDEVEQHRAIREEPGVDDEGRPVAVKVKDHARGGVRGKTKEGYPEFGRGMRKHWGFKEGYINFNNGSYGSPPLPVLKAMRQMSDECEANPDYYMRRTYMHHLRTAREQVANLMGASVDEVVLTPNTTHAINNVLREIEWGQGDIILAYNTTYGAVGQTIKYITDKHPGVTMESIDIDFPVSHREILEKTVEMVERYNKVAIPNYTGQARPVGKAVDRRVRCVVVDQISSVPGVLWPWERIVAMCKKYGIISLVDAAHAIGQVKIDIKRSDPDFWISNCHKWLYAHRGCAALYVPLRNQGVIRSSMPTGALYESTRYPMRYPYEDAPQRHWAWAKQYEWDGTRDWAPFLSVTPALAFREEIGGEERIMAYCNSLAIAGGQRLAQRWGGGLMATEDSELIAAMVNVALPGMPVPKSLEEEFKQLEYLQNAQFEANVYSAPFLHAGKWWTRFSCQVWNDLDDFDAIAEVLEKAIEGINAGKHHGSHDKAVEDEISGRPEDLPTTADE